MNTRLFGSVVDKYNRDLRIRRFKRALAWCGIVAAGSLLVFCAGICALRSGILDSTITLGIILLLAWGLWGFVFLKTRH